MRYHNLEGLLFTVSWHIFMQCCWKFTCSRFSVLVQDYSHQCQETTMGLLLTRYYFCGGPFSAVKNMSDISVNVAPLWVYQVLQCFVIHFCWWTEWRRSWNRCSSRWTAVSYSKPTKCACLVGVSAKTAKCRSKVGVLNNLVCLHNWLPTRSFPGSIWWIDFSLSFFWLIWVHLLTLYRCGPE